MRLRYLKSSTVVVEDEGTAVLCDPWLLDGAFYGSWAHYPPLDFEPEEYNDVDYIYVSNIHPDHLHRPTMERLDSDIPVIIHDYATDFLRETIEGMGFDTIELPHGERTHLEGDLHINVFGADDCDPSVCGNYFGRGWWNDLSNDRTTDDSTQFDSIGVFDDGENVLVNANDCRWPRSRGVCRVIDEIYGDVDMLLMPYSASDFYPQCVENYSHEEKLAARNEVIGELYEDAEVLINTIEPDYFMPYAGSYVLSGDLADLNEYVASPTRYEAFWHFLGSDNIEPDHSQPVLLNSEEYFDLDEEAPSEEYTPIDKDRRREYIQTELAERSFPFESDDHPTLSELTDLLETAYQQMDDNREALDWESDTTLLLDLVDDQVAAMSMNGGGYEITTVDEADTSDGYVRISIDDRLLARILRGPQYAHFTSAQIGSHVAFEKGPDVSERPLYHTMSFLHA